MGADVAGRDPGEGGRKRRRSMVRIPADEVPRPNAAPAGNGAEASLPPPAKGPADELVDHAFSNGGLAEGLVPASLQLPGYEPDELSNLEDELVDDDLAEEAAADDDVPLVEPEEADTDPRALPGEPTVRTRAPEPPPRAFEALAKPLDASTRAPEPPPKPADPDPSASIAALVRAVSIPPPPTDGPSASPWSEADDADSGEVVASVPPPPAGAPSATPAAAPPASSAAPPPAAAAAPPAPKPDEEELDGAEMEEVDPTPPPMDLRARSITPVVPVTAVLPPPAPPPAAAAASATTPAAPSQGGTPPAPPVTAAPAARPAPPPMPASDGEKRNVEPAARPPSAPGAPPAPVGADSPLRPRKKRRSKQWFEEVFDDDYLRTLPYLTARQTEKEAAFVADSLQVPAGGAMLDLACGYGRHAMELAGKGFQVTGLDLSLPLLIRAADAARRSGLQVNFIHGDMREMTFEDEFDGAYCMFTSFGYFDDDTNRKVAANLARAIKPGGRLLFDVVNRDYLVRDLPTRVWWQGEGCVVLEEVDFNYFSSRLQVQRSIIFEDGRQTEQEISIRAYSLHEIGKILHHAGFRVTEVSGGLALRGKFFGASSRQLIVLAEKKPFTP
jgi:SAM-dependent methyltransferase